MPDGALPPRRDALPFDLVHAATWAFDVDGGHVWVVAAVNWIMWQRGDRQADPLAVANHYALWCFDKTYYSGLARIYARLRMADR